MKTNLINYIKTTVCLIVIVGFNVVHAGSFEDFFTAIKRDDPGTLQKLLARGFDPNTTNPEGQYGLYLAFQEPSLKAAQVLIDWRGTNFNLLNAKGESPLMLAALNGLQTQAETLVKKGADVNKTGWAPLHYAASNGHVKMISLLLEHSAYIDAESPNGTTPLMMAAMYGSQPAVKLLLDEGADPLLKNRQGLTALQFAQRGNRSDSIALISAAVRGKQPAGKW